MPAVAARPPAAARMSAAPTLPPRYRVLDRLGVGGIGEVWRVEDANVGRDLAAKVLRPDRRTPEHAARLAREALLTGRLQHPGVPPVVEQGVTADGGPFFAMKLVGGRTLRELLKEPPKPRDGGPSALGATRGDLPRLLTVFRQVCDAVGYAHSQGVIHRDLKPSNVMVGDHGEVQVMDWGMARLAKGEVADAPDESTFLMVSEAVPEGETRASGEPAAPAPSAAGEATVTPGSGATPADPLATLTAAGAGLGTPAYMPPEQARGERDRIDARSDVFGLGAILCTILTGRAPFADAAPVVSFRKAAAGDLTDAFARLDAADADDALKTLCRRCLSADPADRPANGTVLGGAVRGYEDGVRARLERERTDRAAAEVRVAEEKKRRRVWAGLATVAVLLLFTAGAAAWGWQQRRLTDRLRAEAARTEIAGLLDQAAALRNEYRFDAAETLLANAESRLPMAADGGLTEAVAQADKDLAVVRELDRIRSEKMTPIKVGFDVASAGGLDGPYSRAFRAYGIGAAAGDISGAGAQIAASPVSAALVSGLDDWATHEADDALEARLFRLAQTADPDPIRQAVLADRGDALRRVAAGSDPATLRPTTAVLLARRLRKHDKDRTLAAEVLAAASEAHPADFWLHVEAAGILNLRSDGSRITKAATLFGSLPSGPAAEALGHLRAALALRPENAAVHVNLGLVLAALGRDADAERSFREAIRFEPVHAGAYANLGVLLSSRGRSDEAEAAFRESVEIEPGRALMHFNLAALLNRNGRFKEAEAAYRETVRLDPAFAIGHGELGGLLQQLGRTADAEAALREALRLDPEFAEGHVELGNLLLGSGRFAEAEAAYREAIRLDPSFLAVRMNLGVLLERVGRTEEAEWVYRDAMRIAPSSASPHFGLGAILSDTGRPAAAEAEYREALRLDPDLTPVQQNLGLLLERQGRMAEAEAPYRAVVRLAPDDPRSHYDLGIVLGALGRTGDAEASYRKAVRLDPEHRKAYRNLGRLLIERTDRYAEAAGLLRRSQDVGADRPGWRSELEPWVAQADALAANAGRLDAYFNGTAVPPGGAQGLALADFALTTKNRPLAAVRLYDAGLGDPDTPDRAKAAARYNGACAAVRCSAGRQDAAELPADQRDAWRAKARGWLRADLARWRAIIDTNRGSDGRLPPPAAGAIAGQLRHWLADPDLAPVRGGALAGFSPANRSAWEDLWEGHAAALRATGAVVAPKPESAAKPGPDDTGG